MSRSLRALYAKHWAGHWAGPGVTCGSSASGTSDAEQLGPLGIVGDGRAGHGVERRLGFVTKVAVKRTVLQLRIRELLAVGTEQRLESLDVGPRVAIRQSWQSPHDCLRLLVRGWWRYRHLVIFRP